MILAISPGIRLDFEIAANRTSKETSALHLYQRLLTKTTNPQSDFRYDYDFGRFSSVGQLSQLSFSESDYREEQKNLQFEELRHKYNRTNACELFTDKKNGILICPDSFAVPRVGSAEVGIIVAASLAWLF